MRTHPRGHAKSHDNMRYSHTLFLFAAYETLSDAEKRQIYDQYGEEGLKQHNQQQGQRGGGMGGGIFDM